MKVRALDTNNDWSFGKGRNNYKKDLDALIQNISTRIKSWKGNCFFALDDGVDWTNYFDIGTKTFLDLDIKRVILQTDGVLRISNYSSEMTLRSIGISVDIATVYGSTAIVL